MFGRLHPFSQLSCFEFDIAIIYFCICIIMLAFYSFIKTHGSVSYGPRSRRATPVSILTGRTITSFSHLCISVITYLIGTKFTTQLPASQGSLHSKREGNRSAISEIRTAKVSLFFLRYFFFFVFSHTCKNCYNRQTRAAIWYTERESNGES